MNIDVNRICLTTNPTDLNIVHQWHMHPYTIDKALSIGIYSDKTSITYTVVSLTIGRLAY